MVWIDVLMYVVYVLAIIALVAAIGFSIIQVWLSSSWCPISFLRVRTSALNCLKKQDPITVLPS